MITQINKKITQISATKHGGFAKYCGEKYSFLGQSVIEYFVILTVVLAVILSSGVRERIRDAFNVYFTNASGKIVTTQ